MKRNLLAALAAGFSLLLAAPTTAGATSVAASVTEAATTTGTSIRPPSTWTAQVSPGQVLPAEVPAGNCAALQARLHELARRGQTRAACYEPDNSPQTAAAAVAALRRASGAARPGATVPFPPQCANFPRRAWHALDRFRVCAITDGSITIIAVPSGKILGTLTFGVYLFAYTDRVAKGWIYQANIIANTFSGIGLPAVVSGSASCSGACTKDHVSFPPQPVGIHKVDGGDAGWLTTITTVGSQGVSSANWSFTFIGAGWSATTDPVTAPRNRCDRALPGDTTLGCVFPDVVMGLLYSRSALPDLVSHITRAQNSGLPGKFPSGTPLTRLTDPTQRDRNQRKACPKGFPRPTGKTCDEYPFASTNQGAASGGGNARTFPGCSIKLPNPPPPSTGARGYSVCMINGPQNSLGGVDLKAFYNGVRIISNDKFLIGSTA
jgi:hypothetical protein